jgi:Cys-tRNA(Pro)/Cys-tRNA(Cys) deacylase
VAYELKQYAVGAEHMTAAEVARAIDMPPEQVFKTLLARAEPGGHCFAVIPADADLDLKALARAGNNRRATLVPLKEVQPLTGYVRGGVTALAAKKAFAVYLDESALGLDRMAVSAGVRGLQVVLSPRDYLRAARAVAAPLRAGSGAGQQADG